jgi:hypothetical protein
MAGYFDALIAVPTFDFNNLISGAIIAIAGLGVTSL